MDYAGAYGDSSSVQIGGTFPAVKVIDEPVIYKGSGMSKVASRLVIAE